MNTLNLTKKIIAIIISLTFMITARSQNASIGCDSKFFVSYGSGNTANSTTSVSQLTVAAGIVTGNSFSTDPSAIGFNAMGINPVDGYIYALRYPNPNQKLRLVKIGTGTPNNVTDLGALNTTAAASLQNIAYAGCFSATGTFYFVTTSGALFSMANSELGSGAAQRNATYIATLSPSDIFADIAIDPTDGQMYGVNLNSDFGLYKIDKANGTVQRMGTYPNNNSLGTAMIGLFFTESGNLYAYRSDGPFYLLNKTNGSGNLAGTGSNYSFGDGCSCSFRVGHSLAAPATICPTVANGGQPTFNFTAAVQNLSGTPRSGTSYTLVLTDKFSFTETAATIAANFTAAGLTNSGAVLSSVSGGTNNKLVVSGMTIPNLNAIPNVSIGAKLSNNVGFTSASFQSVISGLPSGIGSSDLSDNPATPSPDDSTLIERCISPLPVKLLNFAGKYKNNTTILNWQTEGEVNFARFQIERSQDGIRFDAIGTVTGSGTVSSTQSYKYYDNQAVLAAKNSYYRLRLIDIDGNFTYSNIILIRRDQQVATTAISIIPNPLVKGNPAAISFNAAAPGKASYYIIDVNGKIVLQQLSPFFEGYNSISLINIEKLLPGTYAIKLFNGTESSSAKFSILK